MNEANQLRNLMEAVDTIAGVSSKPFYVYHKVKGDRMGGPDYDLLKTFNNRDDANEYAASYNTKHGYTNKGMHYAIVTTKKMSS